MLSQTKPPFRAEHIGSLLRPQSLLETRAAFSRGEISPAALTEAEDKAIKDALALQKRVGLARALVLRPELLLVDDPLTGLDPRNTNWWLGFMDALSRGHPLLTGQPMTLVVTTTDLRPWKGHARQFAVLKDQKLSVLGSWSQLENATDELVRELLTT